MQLFEKRADFALSRSETSLIAEMAQEFLLSFPEAWDVQRLLERVTDFYEQEFNDAV